MEMFKKCADRALGDIMGCGEHSDGTRLTAGLDLKDLSQDYQLYDSIIF